MCEAPASVGCGASGPDDGTRLAGSAWRRPLQWGLMEISMPRLTNDAPLRRSLRPRGPVRFGLSERHEGGTHVVHLDGELDVLTAPKLAAELDAVVRKQDGNLVIDLRDAVFIDSAGLHILLNAHRRLTRASRRMSVVCGEGPVRRVIELARLVETLGVVSSFEELAVRSSARSAAGI